MPVIPAFVIPAKAGNQREKNARIADEPKHKLKHSTHIDPSATGLL